MEYQYLIFVTLINIIMKKIRKIVGIIFLSFVLLSFCIPKGGPNRFRSRPKNLVNKGGTYEIVVDFSTPSCQDRLFKNKIRN